MVIDPDVLVRRAVRDALQALGLHAVAFGCWHDGVRQFARLAPRLKQLPLPQQEPEHDSIEIWHHLLESVCPPHRALSVLPAVSLRRHRNAQSPRKHPLQLLSHELRECHQMRRDPEAHHGLAPISRAERRVLELLQQGRSNKTIAEQLCLSQRTVESHLHRLFRKLKVTNRMELALVAA